MTLRLRELLAGARPGPIRDLCRTRPSAAKRVLDDVDEWTAAARRMALPTGENALRMQAALQRPVQPGRGSPHRL